MATVDSRGKKATELLLAQLLTGATVEVCASRVGISERTAFRILKNPKTQAQFQAMKKAVLDRAVLKLGNAVSDAIDTLLEVHKDKIMPPASRVTAACRIIQHFCEYGPVGEIEERLAELERQTITIDAKPERKGTTR